MVDPYARTKTCRVNAVINVVDRPHGIDTTKGEQVVARYHISGTLESIVEKMQQIDHEYASQKKINPGRYVDTWNRQSRIGQYLVDLDITEDELRSRMNQIWKEEAIRAPCKIIGGISRRPEIRYKGVR